MTQQVDAETMEKLILENKDMIKHISDALVEKNKLTGEEFGALMN